MRGAHEVQTKTLALVILCWRTFGLQITWKKTERSRAVKWIWLQIEVSNPRGLTPGKIAEIIRYFNKWWDGPGMFKERELRTFAFKCSWLGGIVPQVKPLMRQIWGALSAPRPTEKAAP